MSQRVAAVLLLAVALPAYADDPSREDLQRLQRLQEIERNLSQKLAKTADANADKQAVPAAELMQDVNLLQTLDPFKLTAEQRKALRSLARETAGKPQPPKDVKVSAELHKTLVHLRAALLKGDDKEADKLSEKLDELRKKEKVEFDDEEAEITETARQRAPEALKLLSAKQVALYLAAIADDVADPLELMTDAAGKVRSLPEDEWKATRDDIADRVATLVAGLDEARVDEISEAVAALLIEARNLTDEQFKARKPELEKAARKIVGDLGPTEILRNVLERTLAEVLSNPRLAAVLSK
jgi:hypothetical protein